MAKQATADWYNRAALTLVNTAEALTASLTIAIEAKIIAIDCETRPRDGIAFSGLDVRPWPGACEHTRARLAGISIAVSPYSAYYIPLQHNVGNVPLEAALPELRRLGAAIEAGELTVCMWNAPFDQALLTHVLGFKRWPPGSFVDGQILDRFIRPHAHSHGLKSAVASALGDRMLEFSAPSVDVWVPELDHDHPLFTPRRNTSVDFGAIAPADAVQYAAGDALQTLRYVLAAASCDVREDTASLIALEHAFVAAMRALPRAQIAYDRAHVLALAAQYMEASRFCSDLLRDFGVENPSSPKQIADLLSRHGYSGANTDKRNLAVIPRDQEELRAVASLVRQSRTARLYISNYIQPLINADHAHELCGSWQASGAKSGRMSAGPAKGRSKGDVHVFSSWMPHGQPKRDEFRRIYVARPGRSLIRADYVSQEYRVVAVLADAPSWIEIFTHPDPDQQDVHKLTAQALFREYDQVDDATRKALRATGKTCNFAVIYGSSAAGIASLLECSVEYAESVLATFYDREPALRRFQDECQAQAKKFGRVYSYFGRPISVRASDTVEDDDQQTEVHASVNYRVQSTCSDILKLAVTDFMQLAAASIEAIGGDDSVRLCNLVHDEVVVETLDERAYDVAVTLRECMERAAPSCWPVRLPVEVVIGKTWAG